MTNEEGKTGTASASVTVSDVAPAVHRGRPVAVGAGRHRGRHGHALGPVHRSRPAQPDHRHDRLGRRHDADRALRALQRDRRVDDARALYLLGSPPVFEQSSRRRPAGPTPSTSRCRTARSRRRPAHPDHGQQRRTRDPDRERRQRGGSGTISSDERGHPPGAAETETVSWTLTAERRRGPDGARARTSRSRSPARSTCVVASATVTDSEARAAATASRSSSSYQGATVVGHAAGDHGRRWRNPGFEHADAARAA